MTCNTAKSVADRPGPCTLGSAASRAPQAGQRRPSLLPLGGRLCLLLLLSVTAGFTHSRPEDDLKHYVFKRLEAVRLQKKSQLLGLFAQVEKKARGVKSDRTLDTFFRTMNRDKHLIDPAADIEPALRKGIEQYQRAIDDYFIASYPDFYDMLFIDSNGFIFYTLRKEPDYRSNIFSAQLAATRLAQCLRTPEEEFFVDFQYYSPAEEPAAFFLTRVYEGGECKGWIVMQYALNMLNALLVEYQELGDTGEVYVVNEDLQMLTDSRFAAESTRLKKRIDTAAVRDAFQSGRGSRLSSGYRGVTVFTSYETFELWGSRWAIVASIEEDEIITLHFKNNKQYYLARLRQHLREHPARRVGCANPCGRAVKVDIDESARAVPGEILQTRGVSTCTAITACLPGSFGYMAHISPRDKIYDPNNLTHLLKDMIRKIQYHEIHLHEIPRLQIVVVANHLNSIGNILDRLIAYGIRLSQIRFLYEPGGRYASVVLDCGENAVLANWAPADPGQQPVCQSSLQADDLGAVAKNIFQYR